MLADAHPRVNREAPVGIVLRHVVEDDLPMIPHHIVGHPDDGNEAAAPERGIRRVRDIDLDLDLILQPPRSVLLRLGLQQPRLGDRLTQRLLRLAHARREVREFRIQPRHAA